MARTAWSRSTPLTSRRTARLRAQKGVFADGIGRSRGGWTSKLHGLADALGRPRVLLLSAGNTNDIAMARALFEAGGPATKLIADRGYDANHFRDLLAAR